MKSFDSVPAEEKWAGHVKTAWAFWMCANFSHSNKIGGGVKYSNDQNTQVPRTMLSKKSQFTERLKDRIENCYIENNDALEVLKSRNSPKAFHYIDPPYPGADQGHYKGYTDEDLERLLRWLMLDCNGKFMLSNYQHPLIDEYVKANGWIQKQFQQTANAANRKNVPATRKKVEILVMNYTHQKTLFDA